MTDALADVSEDIERRFDLLLAVPDDHRARLYHAMRHAALCGGQRLRALIVFAAADLFKIDRESAARTALAVECVHVFSLIHDDLPTMNGRDVRQGRPTVHKVYGDATAILAGDCLHALAFEILGDPATHPDPLVRTELVLELARASGRACVVGGGATMPESDEASVDGDAGVGVQAPNTSPTIFAAVEACAILARVPPRLRTILRRYAHDIGVAFEIADGLRSVDSDDRHCARGQCGNGRERRARRAPLIGTDRTLTKATMLIDQSLGHLQSFGQEADMLRAIAHYAVE